MNLYKMLIALLAFIAISCHADDQYALFIDSVPETFSGEAVIKTEHAYYVGELGDGKPHGNGMMVNYSGHIISGEWIDGAFSGQGATIDLDPVKSLRASKDAEQGKPHTGILILDETVYQGPFNQYQLPHGKGVCFEGEIKQDCVYNNGNKQ